MDDATPLDLPRYAIGELADLAGVNRRTVRYYVQRGLLLAPDGAGRGAHYSDSHLARLIQIRDLQAAGIPLADIAQALSGRPAEPLPAAPAPTPDLGRGAAARSPETREVDDAVGRLPRCRAEGRSRYDPFRGPKGPPAPKAAGSGETGSDASRWLRAPVADGVELHVREGALRDDTVAALVRLIAHHVAVANLSATTQEESP